MSPRRPNATVIRGARRPRTPAVSVVVADDLRRRIVGGEWKPGDPLASEPALAEEYSVARTTVRSALQELASQGLVVRRHGSGTYVTPFGVALPSTLTELTSMSRTIQAAGLAAQIVYRHRELRAPTPSERELLSLGDDEFVLDTRREVEAAGSMVAVSFETTRSGILPADFDLAEIEGSILGLCGRLGHPIKCAATEVHAVVGEDLGLVREARRESFVGLYQVHYDDHGFPVFYARTYFREGRFQFSLMRVRKDEFEKE